MKRLKWFAEASVVCKRKQAPTDLRKFDDLYGEKLKIKDCGLARTLAQNSHSVHESCDNVEQNVVCEFLIFFGKKQPIPKSLVNQRKIKITDPDMPRSLFQ